MCTDDSKGAPALRCDFSYKVILSAKQSIRYDTYDCLCENVAGKMRGYYSDERMWPNLN